MRVTHLATVGGIALTLVLAGPALAAGQQSQNGGSQAGNQTFNQLDKNKDGYISQKEARADKQLYDHWGRFDTNKDQRIEPSEFSAFEASAGTGQRTQGGQSGYSGSSGSMGSHSGMGGQSGGMGQSGSQQQ